MNDHTINVLLIDYSPANIQAIRAALLAAEVDVTIPDLFNLEWAGRLAAGLDRLERGGIHVVLMALALPDAHGLEGFTALRTHAPDVPIIVLTRPEDALLGARVVQAGAVDLLIQGRVEGSTLARAIRYAIERYRTRDELRQLRRDLHVSSTRFHNVIARSAEGIMVVDRNGFVRFANPAALDLFGRDEHDLLGALFGFPVVAGQTTEIDVLRSDGAIVVAEMRVAEIVWEGVLAYLASLRDVTERRRIRQERDRLLQEVDAQRRLLQTLVDNAPAGIAVLDGTDLTVKWVNQAYQQFLEEPYRQADITGLRLQEFIPRAEESGLPELFRTVATSGQPYTDTEYEHVGFARGVTYWRWSLLPIGTRYERPIELMIMAVEITEQVLARKRVEELAAWAEQFAGAAQRRADELDAAFAALTEPVFIYDADGSLVKANPAAVSSFGFDPVGEDRAALMQKVAIHHRDGRNITADDLISIRALRGETVVNETFLFTNADGRQSIILGSAAPIWTNGRLSGVVALWHDITERERAEGARAWMLAREQAAHAAAAAALRARDESLAALRESEERLRLLVAGVEDYAIVMLDAEGRVVSWNEGAQRIKGWSAEEILGQHFSRFYPAEAVAAGHPQHELEIAAAEGRYEEEGWRVRKDGSRFFADVTITAIHDDSGNLRGFAKVTRDITERKQAEAEIQKLAKFPAENPNPILRIAKDGVVLYANQASADLQEYWNCSVGRRLPDIWHKLILDTLDSGLTREEEAACGEHVFSLAFVPIVDGGYVNIYGSDITERKRAEEAVRSLTDKLEQRVLQRTAALEAANKDLEAFSYSVSHDLRAPLRSIDGFSQALLEDYADGLDDTGQDYLRRIRAACQRMGQLIDELLSLSRLTRSDMCGKQVDLSALARQIAGALQNTQPERQVEFDIAPGLIATCDPRLLRIALENLLDNAWKFTSKHTHARIEFGATQRDGATVYYVRDDGAGFDMAYADKLFGVFQRLHKLTEFDGTGIGLVTVRRIVERHGGRVWAEGAVEQGATFYFTL